MAPTRKSRSVGKRHSYASEVVSKKKGGNADKSGQRKRKLSDMLGPQWSKEELEHFYEAYRKYGKDWKKVAAAVRNRSLEMVEALFTMNRAYLSLPEGTASVVGLIAMMTDHYGVLFLTWQEGSESEQESDEGTGASQKSQKRAGGKFQNRATKGSDEPFPDLLQFQSAASNYGCLSLLKKRRSESRPRAVAKRTPRVPVSYSYDKDNAEKYLSPIRQGLKPRVGTIDDDVAHEIALALTEASQRGGSPQVSQTPKRKRGTPSPVQNNVRMRDESEMTNSKLHGGEMDEDGCELSLGSTEADNGYYARDRSHLMDTENTGTFEGQQKGKRSHGKRPKLEESVNNQLDDIKEACSGTEEGQTMGAVKGKFGMEVDEKISRSTYKGSRKRSKKVLFKRDEGSTFDALQTLADLSLMMPETTVDTESSIQVKEDKSIDESKVKGSRSSPGVKVTAYKTSKLGKYHSDNNGDVPEAEEGNHQTNARTRTKRQKFLPFKLRMDIPKPEDNTDSHLDRSQKIEATDELKKFVSKGKRTHSSAQPKHGKLVKPPERTSSTGQRKESNNAGPSTTHVPSTNEINLPTKVGSKRKNTPRKLLIQMDTKSSGDLLNGQSYKAVPSLNDKTLKLKDQLSGCLSWYLVQRWCVFEWFYSSIDYPWFAKREFAEYLDHVGLSHVPRLTHVEWGVIKSSLGRPRRFAEPFLKEERDKLYHYRDSVRNHYSELHAGIREGLPADLARPLVVGQKIIAVHPRTREIHDGSVLTVDHSRYRVQFDRHDLGVEFVKDIDCMPLNPFENLPASLTRQNVVFGKFIENLNELKSNVQLRERNVEGCMKFALCENLENGNGPSHMSPSTNQRVNHLLQQQKVRVGPGENINAQQTTLQPSITVHVQGKEADVHALSELTRALNKKEAVVSELRRMNDEVLENQRDGDNSFKDSELFKKQYAAILLQLNEVNELVSSALLFLRQRNTYQGNIPLLWSKSMASLGDPSAHSSSFDYMAYQTQESGSHVAEIVESSRTKAQKMVDAAVQAMSSLKSGGNGIEKIEDAIDFVNNRLSVDELGVPSTSSTPIDLVHVTLTSPVEDQLNTCTSNSLANDHVPDSKLNNLPNENAAQIPSELIANCVATFLMIQNCTERQFPPSDVAQVLDSAVTSLQPCCSQNLPIYVEIQKCMGIIRNQILALIPTTT
ncbi:protein ALWAYS EARLY 3-like isoform X2 [Mangifera indica]|uniref:protein ALWAYS EARLY 3-like isoform X2 n=1 Tax=Mangifera indica TaxID=29780 RepID=UPI001CFA523C|nr:protein ALWAYS EARLY 3-like isoform X2 [Mangifera indica]